MQINFNKFLIYERLGINEEVLKISKEIFLLIKKGEKNFSIDKNSLGIKKIIILKDNEVPVIGLNFDDSTEDTIVLNLNPRSKITEGIIYHELNHTLQFLKIGKDKSIKKLDPLMSLNLTMFDSDFHIKSFENFSKVMYLIQKDEIDSYIYNTYFELLEFFKKNKNSDIDKVFPIILKKTIGYRIFNFLKNYDINELKQIDNETLLRFINTIDRNNHLISKHSLNIVSKYKILTSKTIKPIDYKIKNIDTYLKKIKRKQSESVKYFNKKLIRLQTLIKEKIEE
jgi:hypothetical protein